MRDANLTASQRGSGCDADELWVCRPIAAAAAVPLLGAGLLLQPRHSGLLPPTWTWPAQVASALLPRPSDCAAATAAVTLVTEAAALAAALVWTGAAALRVAALPTAAVLCAGLGCNSPLVGLHICLRCTSTADSERA